MAPRLWVDADACPRVTKEILFRAARRTGLELVLVANQSLAVPADDNIRSVQVSGGFDVADNHIVEHAQAGDVVVTADIPLAAELVPKACHVITPRGERYTEQNIRERLNLRDFMDTMRGSGMDTGGPPPFSKADRQAFANQLDRLLAGVQRQ